MSKVQTLRRISNTDSLHNSEDRKDFFNPKLRQGENLNYSNDHIINTDQNRESLKKDTHTEKSYSPKKKLKLE